MHALVPHQQAARTRPTSAGRLSTIGEAGEAIVLSRPPGQGRWRAANDDDFRVRSGGAALAKHQQAPPWQSRAVAFLASAAARGTKEVNAAPHSEKVEPMLVEGPRGTSLRALGSKDDHKVAGDALSKAIAEQRERRARGGMAQFERSQPGPLRDRAFEAEDLPRPVATRGHRNGMVFGAVYEHCDSTGQVWLDVYIPILTCSSTHARKPTRESAHAHMHNAHVVTFVMRPAAENYLEHEHDARAAISNGRAEPSGSGGLVDEATRQQQGRLGWRRTGLCWRWRV